MVPSLRPAGAGWEEDRRTRIARLVRAAGEGDADAVDELVTEFTPLLWQVARATGLETADAEDVLQTAWLRLVEHLDDIHTPAQLCSWLVTTTRREAWRVLGAGRRQVVLEHDGLERVLGPGPSAEELAVISDQHHRLWVALSRLDERCQELLRIVAFVPRPDYAWVAAELGMRHGSVGPTRGRCLDKLRALLLAPPKENSDDTTRTGRSSRGRRAHL